MADGGNWIAKYGVPSLILSVAAFAFQQQQQVFDRRQANVETGYQFYSDQRTRLLYADDVETELSLLAIVGRAFPSIYCDVRQDLYDRAVEAQDRTGLTDASGRDPILTADIQDLKDRVAREEIAQPTELPYPRNLVENVMVDRTPCEPLSVQAEQMAEVGEAAAAPVETSAAESAAPAAPGDAPAPASRAERGGPSVLVRAPAAAPRVSQAPTSIRVFLHVPLGGAREAGIREFADSARAELASSNFRVMRGVERIAPAQFPSEPVIRYFGPEQEDEARALAEYLSYHYRSEGLQFRIQAIGEAYPNMPPENIEVWIPNARAP